MLTTMVMHLCSSNLQHTSMVSCPAYSHTCIEYGSRKVYLLYVLCIGAGKIEVYGVMLNQVTNWDIRWSLLLVVLFQLSPPSETLVHTCASCHDRYYMSVSIMASADVDTAQRCADI